LLKIAKYLLKIAKYLLKKSKKFFSLVEDLVLLLYQITLSKYYNYKSDPDYEYSPKHNSRHHTSEEALAKLQTQGQSSLAPPKKNERRHSLGGKLAAALHL